MLTSLDNTLSIIDICVCLVDFALIAYLVQQGRRGVEAKPVFRSRIRRKRSGWSRPKAR